MQTGLIVAILLKNGLGTFVMSISNPKFISKTFTSVRRDGLGGAPSLQAFISLLTFISLLLWTIKPFLTELNKHKEKCIKAGQPVTHPYSLKAYRQNIFPSALNTISILISIFAGAHLSPSVSVLMKGTKVVFAAMFTGLILGRKQERYQIFGVVLTMVALLPLMYSESLDKKEEDHGDASFFKKYWPYFAALLSEFVRGIRYVVQDKLMSKEKMAVSFVVFVEAMIGVVISIVVWFLADLMGQESIADVVPLLSHKPIIFGLLTLSMVTSGLVTIAGTKMTHYLGSVMSAVVSEMRIIPAFIFELSLHYFILWNWQIRTYKPFDMIGTSCYVLSGALMIVGAFIYEGAINLADLYPNGVVKHGKGGHGHGKEEKVVASPTTKTSEGACCMSEQDVKATARAV